MNPFLRQPSAFKRTPLRAEQPAPKASGGGVVALRLYDPIDSWGGDWGVSAREFVAVLDDLPDETSEIRLLINSPGGMVWEGLAILNALRSHKARVVAVVEGIAASAASFIAAGVDELWVMPNAELFVHCAWGGCVGPASAMRKMDADLSHEDRNLASIYAAKAGGDVSEWLGAMEAETFYSAEEAVKAGLADRVVEPAEGAEDAAAKAKARFDLSAFRNRGRAPADVAIASSRATAAEAARRIHAAALKPPGRDNAPAPAMPDRQTPAPNGSGPTNQERRPAVAFSDEQLTTLRQKLDIADDADEATILAALDDRLAVPQPAPQTAVPEGHVTISQNVLEEMRIAAQDGQAARAQQLREERDNTIKAAVTAGQISPARRDHWVQAWDKDPAGAKADIESLPKDRIPVNEIGYGKDEPTDPAKADDYWFAGVPDAKKTEG